MEYTPEEILHFSLRWIYNFHEGDLQEAHKDYSCGSDYHWNKYLGKRANDINATQAMTEVVLNMDTEGQTLLINWVLNKNKLEIIEHREWNALSSPGGNS